MTTSGKGHRDKRNAGLFETKKQKEKEQKKALIGR
jgi:hypothetical protein